VGKASFSAYLLHWAMIERLLDAHPGLFETHAKGWPAIGGLVAVALATCAASSAIYRLIEQPFIGLANRLTAASHAAAQGVVRA
jgi:peptidoglycan/LPS O-acetylase OafA/YrhL